MPGFLTRIALLAAALGVFTSVGGPAIAQTFPSRTVKLIVAVPAGGVTDAMARIVAQRLGEAWGQTVVVENRRAPITPLVRRPWQFLPLMA